MQIVRYRDREGKVHYGIRSTDGGVRRAEACPFSPKFKPTDEPADVARVLAPVDPPNVIAIGKNYAEHVHEVAGNLGGEIPDHPLAFAKLTTSIVGPDDAIVLPAEAPDEVDYEAELVLVIGRSCRNVAEREAMDYVLGCTCGNDVSARDCQWKIDKQWMRAKSFDTFCPLGPWIETELDPSDLAVRFLLNGQTMQDGRTSQMIFPPAFLVSYLSRQFTLAAGTCIMTGTPAGVGAKRKPPRFLCPGDVCTVEVEGIGQLNNPVKST
ncbi:MAG: putative protein YisK [Phycisphaerae bacterium]|nr:putative protein YisK [Phycisphaerae bacterium]